MNQKLTATISANESSFRSALDAATASINKTGSAFDRMSDDAKNAEGALNKAQEALSAFGIPTSATEAIAAAMEAVSALADRVGEISEESQKLGISAELFQKLERAAKKVNVPIEELKTAVEQYTGRLAEARSGNESAVAIFAALGLELDKISNMDADARLELVMTALGELSDTTEQNNIKLELFGDHFQQLNPLLEDYRDIIQAVGDAGGIIDDESIAKALELKQQFEQLKNTLYAMVLESGAVEFLNEFLDGIAAVGEYVKNVRENGASAKMIFMDIMVAVASIADLFLVQVNAIGKLLQAIPMLPESVKKAGKEMENLKVSSFVEELRRGGELAATAPNSQELDKARAEREARLAKRREAEQAAAEREKIRRAKEAERIAAEQAAAEEKRRRDEERTAANAKRDEERREAEAQRKAERLAMEKEREQKRRLAEYQRNQLAAQKQLADAENRLLEEQAQRQRQIEKQKADDRIDSAQRSLDAIRGKLEGFGFSADFDVLGESAKTRRERAEQQELDAEIAAKIERARSGERVVFRKDERDRIHEYNTLLDEESAAGNELELAQAARDQLAASDTIQAGAERFSSATVAFESAVNNMRGFQGKPDMATASKFVASAPPPAIAASSDSTSYLVRIANTLDAIQRTAFLVK